MACRSWSYLDLTRLATVVIVRVTMITVNETQIGISPSHGAQSAKMVGVQRVQDQLDADESQDDRQANRQVDQPLSSPPSRKYSCRRPIRANTLAVNTSTAPG